MYLARRSFLRGVVAGASSLWVPGALAEALQRTPAQTAGPFYPSTLPLDTDNDLLIVNDNITPAAGKITHLSGRILDSSGDPVRNALVEIWQVDNNGVYLHKDSAKRDQRDGNFQGFGRFLTSSSGEYYFRTIKPVPYGEASARRTRHIHFAVHVNGRDRFTTQCYVKGELLNEKDSVLNSLTDPAARDSVIVSFAPLPESRAGELIAKFDIVLDITPAT